MNGVGNRNLGRRHRQFPPTYAARSRVAPREHAALHQGAQELLHKQRISAGAVEHEVDQALGRRQALQDPVDQVSAIVRGERLQEEGGRRPLAAHPHRSTFEQLGPRQHEQRDRRLADPVGRVLEEVEGHVLGRVHILEHQQQRPLLGQREEERVAWRQTALRAAAPAVTPRDPARPACGHRIGDLEALRHSCTLRRARSSGSVNTIRSRRVSPLPAPRRDTVP